MGVASVLLLSLGLAMDATAVAASLGLAAPRLRPVHVARVALFFGAAQGLMPLLGWLLGATLGAMARDWDHWIAFALLTGIGVKMLHEAQKSGERPPQRAAAHLFGPRRLAGLAVATSVDAFAAGVTLPMLEAPLGLTALTIALVTAALSGLGVVTGRRFGALLGPRLEVLGAVVLIGLGAKQLAVHLAS